MAALPRIITVDPTGSLAHIVRAVADLLDRSITLIDISSGPDALVEVRRGDCAVLVTTVELEDKMRGYQLAIEVSQTSAETRVIVLAESTDPELDVKELVDSPYVYMHRPVDLNQFARVILAALDGGDIFEAVNEPMQAAAAPAAVNLGQMPYLDAEAARPIIDTLLTDVGAMAIVFANRAGEVLLERGAVGYLDREKLATTLQPMFVTTIEMGELVGGNTRTLHFYDGDTYDVFVISVGLHHFLSLVFNGEAGNRAFGAVNRFGRRAAEDLVALLGASAFVVNLPPAAAAQPAADTSRKARRRKPEEEPQEIFQPLERAVEPETYAEPEPLQLEPVQDMDFSIFDNLEKLDLSNADDLFSLETMADVANQNNRKGGPIDFDQAFELGIMPKLGE
jgi:DNA-binding NarL/FixJ family response regulator